MFTSKLFPWQLKQVLNNLYAAQITLMVGPAAFCVECYCHCLQQLSGKNS